MRINEVVRMSLQIGWVPKCGMFQMLFAETDQIKNRQN